MTRVLIGRRQEDQNISRENVKIETEAGTMHFAGGGRDHKSKDVCRWPLEAGKGKETFSPRVSKRNAVLLTP